MQSKFKKRVAENGVTSNVNSNYLIIRVFIPCYFCLKKL